MNTVTVTILGRARVLPVPNKARRLLLDDLAAGPLKMKGDRRVSWTPLRGPGCHLTLTLIAAARLGLVDLAIGGGIGVAHLSALGAAYRRASDNKGKVLAAARRPWAVPLRSHEHRAGRS